jgi:hypothetical protein
MTSQYDFTDEEWTLIVETPVLVGMAVAQAEDSGFVGSIRERRALSAELGDGAAGNSALGLVAQAAAADTSEVFNRLKGVAPDALAGDAERDCRRLIEVLGRTATPDEVEAFAQWILDVAEEVARAATEQGSRVSPGEVDVLQRVRAALGQD